MKVLQIINSLSMGGAEKLVTEFVPIFQSKGIDMEVACLKLTNSPLEKVVEIKGIGGFNIYNPINIFKLIPLIKKYDLIHVHLFPSLYWVVIAKYLSFAKTKLVYTEHSTNNKRRKSVVFRILDRIIYKGLDKIVTISKEVDEELKKHLNYNDFDNISLIHNGINLKKFAFAEPHPKRNFFDEESTILIQVSSFRYPKDQKTVIDALHMLPKKFKLLLVGTGPNYQTLKSYTESLGLKDRILFLGLRTDIPQLLQMSDFILLSSAYEGMSLSSIEGMSVGKPFIATNVPGLTSIVEGYGSLFEFGNFSQLASIIQDLSDNMEDYKKVAQQCLGRAEMFSLDKSVEKYIQEYKTLVN